ncbi:MAG TPA: polysaccharide deacetylase family protein [Alphaproteobacteria bacterium]|nr:polysaccharide deacetylase family protein [Alphaproteobacteria bacterium]
MKPQRTGPFPYIPIHQRPKLTWPGNARVALWVVPNIEFFPLDEEVPFGIGINPDVLGWSKRGYGGRVGTFRVMEVLARHGIRGTVALNSEVCDAYPQIVDETMKLGWEFMGHGESNARYVDAMTPEEERRVIFSTFDRIEKYTGTRLRGWLSPGVRMTWHTLDFFAEAGCDYFCDFINDDQPYLMDAGGKGMVSIPYSSEINDLSAFLQYNRTAEEFETMIRRQFDVLYREGEESGRVMAICLHPFLIGVPHRIDALDSALEYICGHEGLWRATGSEIVDHYRAATT